jgi:hypothetical protein
MAGGIGLDMAQLEHRERGKGGTEKHYEPGIA